MKHGFPFEKDVSNVRLFDAPLVPTSRYLFTSRKIVVQGLFIAFFFYGLVACASNDKDTTALQQSHSPLHKSAALSSAKVEAATPAPAPSLPPISATAIKKWLAQYIGDILSAKDWMQVEKYRSAYMMLSPEIRSKLTFGDFKTNSEYTLGRGCWMIGGQAIVSQRNSQTWDVGVIMTNVSCSDYRPIYYGDWHFQIQLQNGELVITSIGFYPTAIPE